ncbi:MAG: hypothetical protein KAH57_08425 [Thermoplasmata archaeon]|nr:hypothetical protein [Thermoplasmata archaeon]
MLRKSMIMIISAMMLFTTFMVLGPVDPNALDTRSNGPIDRTTLWEVETAYQTGGATDGVAIGELISSHDGDEAIVLSRDMGVYLTYFQIDTSSWHTEKIWTSPGQGLTPSIGDLMPDKPGNEVLVVGLSAGLEDADDAGHGLATVLYREGGAWRSINVLETDSLLHGCDIGDLDPTIEGNEAVVVGFTREAYSIWYDQSNSTWHSSLICNDTGNLRKAVIADILPENPGNEVVIASKSGKVLLAYGDAHNWTVETIYDGVPLARIAVGDVDPDEGLEIYVGADTFNDQGIDNPTIIGIKKDGTDWITKTILSDTDKNRGVWVGDVDPNVDGQELYIFGYSRILYQAHGSFSTGYEVSDLYKDTARGHEIRIGDLLTDRPGYEIGIVGYSEALKVIYPSGWEAETAYTSGDATDGVAIGELLSEHEGSEAVILSRDMGVYLSYYEPDTDSWFTEKIWTAQGQGLTPAIGDLMPDKPGNEILVVGLSAGLEDAEDAGNGLATVLYREAGVWTPVKVFEVPSLLHGCDIGDVDPGISGNEAVIVGFTREAYMIWYEEATKTWHSSLICNDTGNLRKVVIADILLENPGNEMVIASKSGKVLLAYGRADNWTVETIYDGVPLARIAVGDIDPDAGLEIYVGADTFNDQGIKNPTIIGIKRSNNAWINRTILSDTDKNRGVWVADVDPDISGQELYIYGYSRILYKAHGTFSAGFEVSQVFTDTARGHEIRIGDLMTSRPGLEIALVGYTRAMKVVSFNRDAPDLHPPRITGSSSVTIASGEVKAISLTIEGSGPITLQINVDDNINAEITPGTLFIKGEATINIDPGHTRASFETTVQVTAMGQGGSGSHNISISVAGDDSPPTIIAAVTPEGETIRDGTWVGPDDELTFSFNEPIDETTLSDLKVTMGGQELEGATFNLSDDGSVLTLYLNNATTIGTIQVHLVGMADLAGNPLSDLVIEVRVEVHSEGSGSDLAILIVVLILIALLVMGALLYMRKMKGEDDEEQTPQVPRQI